MFIWAKLFKEYKARENMMKTIFFIGWCNL
jgi:hypothetical protein